MKKRSWFFAIFIFFSTCYACQLEKVETTSISLSPLPQPDSITILYENVLLGGCNYIDGNFKMMIEGITLGTRTPAPKKFEAHQTKKGAYLHLILDDSLHYINHDKNTNIHIPDGTYEAVAFAVKDYHESIKGEQAYMYRVISIKKGKMVKSLVKNAPKLVYAAPWGKFKYAKNRPIILDFYLIDTKLDPDGNRVRLKIDGQEIALIDKWRPYYIRGLSLGVHQISLELINWKGEVIYGPVQQKISCILEDEDK